MSYAEILNATVAVGSLVVAALAALAAFRSAGSAAASNKALIDEQLQAGRRDVAQLVAGCYAAHRDVQFLARTLRILDRSLAFYNNAHGGSRQELNEAAIVKQLAAADISFKAASTFAGDPVALGRLAPEDFDRLRIDLTLRLAELQSIANELSRESGAWEAQVLQHRAQGIAAPG